MPLGQLGDDLNIVRRGRARVFDTHFVRRRAFEISALGAFKPNGQRRGDDFELDLLLNLQVAIGFGGERVEHFAGFFGGQHEIELASFAGA